MTIVTHVLATTLGVQAFELHGSEAVLAYVFGVGVDVDHAVKLPFYLRAVGLKNRRGYYWRSSLHEPVGLLWVLPLCLFFRTLVPAPVFVVPLAIDSRAVFATIPSFPDS